MACGRHVCPGGRNQGVPDCGIALSRLAQALGRDRRHDCISGLLPVRPAGAIPWLSAQRCRIEDLVPRHGWGEFGRGVWPAGRAELVVSKPVYHRSIASAAAAAELQSGRSEQAAALHEPRRSRLRDGELGHRRGEHPDRAWLHLGHAAGLVADRKVGRGGDRHPVLSDDGGFAIGTRILLRVVVLPDHGLDASCRLSSAAKGSDRNLGRGCGRLCPARALVAVVSDRAAGLWQ